MLVIFAAQQDGQQDGQQVGQQADSGPSGDGDGVWRWGLSELLYRN